MMTYTAEKCYQITITLLHDMAFNLFQKCADYSQYHSVQCIVSCWDFVHYHGFLSWRRSAET